MPTNNHAPCSGTFCPCKYTCHHFLIGADAPKEKKSPARYDHAKGECKRRVEVQYCGSCRRFVDEDVYGEGWCDPLDCSVSVESKACNEFEKE